MHRHGPLKVDDCVQVLSLKPQPVAVVVVRTAQPVGERRSAVRGVFFARLRQEPDRLAERQVLFEDGVEHLLDGRPVLIGGGPPLFQAPDPGVVRLAYECIEPIAHRPAHGPGSPPLVKIRQFRGRIVERDIENREFEREPGVLHPLQDLGLMPHGPLRAVEEAAVRSDEAG